MGFRPKINSNRCRRWFGFAKKKILALKKYGIFKKIYKSDGYRIIVKPLVNKAIIDAPPGLILLVSDFTVINEFVGHLSIYYADQYAEIGTKLVKIKPLTYYKSENPAEVEQLIWPGPNCLIPGTNPDQWAVSGCYVYYYFDLGENGEINDQATYTLLNSFVVAPYSSIQYNGVIYGPYPNFAAISVLNDRLVSFLIRDTADGMSNTYFTYAILHLKGSNVAFGDREIYDSRLPNYWAQYDPPTSPTLAWGIRGRSCYAFPWQYEVTEDNITKIKMRVLYLIKGSNFLLDQEHACFMFANFDPVIEEFSPQAFYGALEYIGHVGEESLHLIRDLSDNWPIYGHANVENYAAGQGASRLRSHRNIYFVINNTTIGLMHYTDPVYIQSGHPEFTEKVCLTLNISGAFAETTSYDFPFSGIEAPPVSIVPFCTIGDTKNDVAASCYLYWEEKLLYDGTLYEGVEYGIRTDVHRLFYGTPLGGNWTAISTYVDDKQLISFSIIEVSYDRICLLGLFCKVSLSDPKEVTYFGVLDTKISSTWRIGRKIADWRMERGAMTIFGDYPDVMRIQKFPGVRITFQQHNLRDP